MNENGFNTEQNIENQPPSSNANNKNKFNKKDLIIPLIIILIILFIFFKEIMLQLLGVILLVVCIGFALLKAIKYIISFGGCLLNIIISMLAFLLILSAMGWVIELFS